MDTKTIRYYNDNAQAFVRSTQNVTFNTIQDRFLSKLDDSAYILDFGCGSGRDTKYFFDHGHQVDAIDGSAEMVKVASEYSGLPVRHMYFVELDQDDMYDAIWACSSLLHVARNELPDIFRRCAQALKEDGLFYVSFKYGDFEGYRNQRYFTDLTEESLEKLVAQIPGLEIEETWYSADVRPGREEEKWLNAFLRKRSIK